MNVPMDPVLLTGCSSGIGLTTALHLAGRGYRVIASVKSLEEQGTLREDARRAGLDIDVLPMDNTDEGSVAEGMAYVEMKYGKLHACVNNAGIGGGGFFEELQEAELREIFETNFFGTARVTRHAIPLLRRGTPSYLVAISSIAGRIGVPAMSSYHASKFAIEGLFECLYYELAPYGVRVSLVEPGIVRTTILQSGFRLSRRFDDPESFYRDRTRKLWKDFQARFERTASPPETVARVIEHILTSPRPPLRNPSGLDAKILLGLHKLLPEWIMTRLWSKVSG